MAEHQCDVTCNNDVQVKKLQTELSSLPLIEVTQFLKAIADDNRTKIVSALCIQEELCVCDIANILDVTVANASSHLRKLHKQGVVKTRRDGKLVHYSLDDDHVKDIMLTTIQHMEEIK